jgi:hypothetical protein
MVFFYDILFSRSIANNRLYNIPMGGDFHDFEADYFLMNDNRISAILGRLQGFQYSSSVPVLL